MGKLSRCLACVCIIAAAAVADDIRKITLKTNDLIYDPVSHKIYASVPSSAGLNGNSIAVIDPWTGYVGPSIFIGSEPKKLALSDDGQYLYVALDGAPGVRRFHVPTLTPGLQFGLGSDTNYGPFRALDLEVLPGSPEAVAVCRATSSSYPGPAGVAVYDDGVQRPVVTTGYDDSQAIEFSASGSLLYGINGGRGDFRRMAVHAFGVSVLDVTDGVADYYDDDMVFDNGLIYFPTGMVYDPEAKAPVGLYWGITDTSGVQPDSSTGRTFFLTGNEYSATRNLLAFDQGTFLPAGSLTVGGVSDKAGSLIRWGANGLAFRAGNDVFLIRTALVPAPTATLVPAEIDGDGIEEVFADFGPAGLWIWDGAWTPLSSMNPDGMAAADLDGDGVQELAVDFGPSGLWVLDAGSWTRLTGANPDGLMAADTDGDAAAELVVDIAGLGAWAWDSGAWTQLSGANVDSLIAADVDADGRAEVVADAGTQGLWLWDGGVWTVMSTLDAQGMTAASAPTGDSVVVDFGATGIWQWTGGAWTQLTGADPDSVHTADTDLDGVSETAADFGALGVWLWDGAWMQLSGRDADSLAAADTDGNGVREIVADFGLLGLWLWNGAWVQISALDPSAITEANLDADLAGEIVADFGSVGVWVLNNGAWSRIR